MKTSDKILIAVIVALLLAITLTSFQQTYAAFFGRIKASTLCDPSVNNVLFTSESYVTRNGKRVTVFELKNPEPAAKKLESICLRNVSYEIPVTLLPNDTLSVFKIKDFIIVPSISALKINRTSSYYEMNRQLRIRLLSNPVPANLFVVSKHKPTRVIASGNIKWKYSPRTHLLNVTLLSQRGGTLVIDFTLYPLRDEVIVYDNARVEELLYEIEGLRQTYGEVLRLKQRINKSVETLGERIAVLKREITSEIERKNRVALEIEEIRKRLEHLESEFNEMMLSTNDRVALSSLQFVLIAICLAVSLLYFVGFTLNKLR